MAQSDAASGGSSKTSLAELMKAPVTWAEREKMDTEYQHLMAELGQGQAPDLSKGGQSKCIISRSGGANSSGPQPLLSIQHHQSSNQHHHRDRDRDSRDRDSRDSRDHDRHG